jgi:hypothetical protein
MNNVVGQFVWGDTPDKLVSSLRLEMPATRLCLNSILSFFRLFMYFFLNVKPLLEREKPIKMM